MVRVGVNKGYLLYPQKQRTPLLVFVLDLVKVFWLYRIRSFHSLISAFWGLMFYLILFLNSSIFFFIISLLGPLLSRDPVSPSLFIDKQLKKEGVYWTYLQTGGKQCPSLCCGTVELCLCLFDRFFVFFIDVIFW